MPELHVTGKTVWSWVLCKTVGVGIKEGQIQHAGIGTALLREAESVAKEEFDCSKMLVISAVGVRGYYAKFGYNIDGPYMAKNMV